MNTFTYNRSYKIVYWGCAFDSILELKFALSIQNNYEFLRSPISIYYDPLTKIPTNYIRDNIRRYTPDFLIRDKISREAFLVEIKPRAFENERQLIVRKEVAENYIRWKNYDWSFKIIFDDEIILDNQTQMQFHKCCRLIKLSERKLWFKELNDRYDRSRPSLFNVPSNKTIRFVMFGERTG